MDDIAVHSSIQLKEASPILPQRALSKGPKVSRGENYLDLPYLILDYPRLFHRQSTFAIRHMFWWGNFFSSTLHLEGEALSKKRALLWTNLDLLHGQGMYLCVHENPWNYHYKEDNYLPLDSLAPDIVKEYIEERTFLKLSRFLLITEWQNFHDHALESLSLFLRVLKNHGELAST